MPGDGRAQQRYPSPQGLTEQSYCTQSQFLCGTQCFSVLVLGLSYPPDLFLPNGETVGPGQSYLLSWRRGH